MHKLAEAELHQRRSILSWQIGTELVRRQGKIELADVYSALRDYDNLGVVETDSGRVPILMERTADGYGFHVTGTHGHSLISWEAIMARPLCHTLQDIEQRMGWVTPVKSLATSRHILAHRFLSYVATLANLRTGRWEVRSSIGYEYDDNKWINGLAEPDDFPTANYEQLKAGESWRSNRRRFWSIMRDDEDLFVIDSDAFLHVSTEREPIDLMRQFERNGRTVVSVVGQYAGAWLG